MNGFYNVYKESGMSSARVVAIIKRRLFNLLGNKLKVGHFGTLDPDADGVLPIAIGRATKLFDYQLNSQKAYLVTFEFGFETNSLDLSGKVISQTSNIPLYKDVNFKIAQSCGEIDQIPPKVSAKNVNGKRAYALEKEGIDFELAPKKVALFAASDLSVDSEGVYSLSIVCSKGFYVRSFIRDLAHSLDSLATVRTITRIKNGIFDIKDSVKIDDIDLMANLISVENVLLDYPVLVIPEHVTFKLINGVRTRIKDAPSIFRAYVDNEFIGIGETIGGKSRIKVFLK